NQIRSERVTGQLCRAVLEQAVAASNSSLIDPDRLRKARCRSSLAYSDADAKLNIQRTPNLSRQVPQLAPQNMSASGAQSVEPSDKASKSRCVSSRVSGSRLIVVLFPTRRLCPMDSKMSVPMIR